MLLQKCQAKNLREIAIKMHPIPLMMVFPQTITQMGIFSVFCLPFQSEMGFTFTHLFHKIENSRYTNGPSGDFSRRWGFRPPKGSAFFIGEQGRVYIYETMTFGNSGFASVERQTEVFTVDNGDGTVEHHTVSILVMKDKKGNAYDVSNEEEDPFDELDLPDEEDSDNDDGRKDVTKRFKKMLHFTKGYFSAMARLIDPIIDNSSFMSFGYLVSRKIDIFKSLVGKNAPFDLKKGLFDVSIIGEQAYYGEALWQPQDFGNYNFGVAAKAYGYSLTFAKFGAGYNQTFTEFTPDFSNWSGFFDRKRDTDFITDGYYHF